MITPLALRQSKICSRCNERPQREEHRWCQLCHTDYMRRWRLKRARRAMREARQAAS